MLLVSLGVGQIGLGFVFLTIGGRLIPAAEVALITLLEVVLGPLWVWLVLSERPGVATLVGGVVVLAAVAIQARGGGVEQRVPVPYLAATGGAERWSRARRGACRAPRAAPRGADCRAAASAG